MGCKGIRKCLFANGFCAAAVKVSPKKSIVAALCVRKKQGLIADEHFASGAKSTVPVNLTGTSTR
jgi:hypothetical protein